LKGDVYQHPLFAFFSREYCLIDKIAAIYLNSQWHPFDSFTSDLEQGQILHRFGVASAFKGETVENLKTSKTNKSLLHRLMVNESGTVAPIFGLSLVAGYRRAVRRRWQSMLPCWLQAGRPRLR
jgi:hypothetical protein